MERPVIDLDWEIFFSNSVAGAYVTTPEGRVVRVNAALARIMGYGSAEQLLEELVDVTSVYVPPARRAEFVDLVQRTGHVVEFESMVRRRDGSLVCIAESSWSVRNAAGETVAFAGILVDATDRRRATDYDRYMAQVRLGETIARNLREDVTATLEEARAALVRGDADAVAGHLDAALSAAEALGARLKSDELVRRSDAVDSDAGDDRSAASTAGDDLEFGFDLAGTPESVALARHLAREALDDRGLGEHISVVELLTSELVTNAVLHTRADIRLSIAVGEKVRVAVADRSDLFPATVAADADAITGRGMGLVSALSSASGVERTAEGKTVWFEIDPGEAAWIDHRAGGRGVTSAGQEGRRG